MIFFLSLSSQCCQKEQLQSISCIHLYPELFFGVDPLISSISSPPMYSLQLLGYQQGALLYCFHHSARLSVNAHPITVGDPFQFSLLNDFNRAYSQCETNVVISRFRLVLPPTFLRYLLFAAVTWLTCFRTVQLSDSKRRACRSRNLNKHSFVSLLTSYLPISVEDIYKNIIQPLLLFHSLSLDICSPSLRFK